jgi:hypothetical protein
VVSSAGVPPLIGTAARRRRALAHLSPIFDLHLYRARNPSDVDWSAYDFIALVQLTVDTIAMSSGLDGNLGAPRTFVLTEMTRTAAAMAPQPHARPPSTPGCLPVQQTGSGHCSSTSQRAKVARWTRSRRFGWSGGSPSSFASVPVHCSSLDARFPRRRCVSTWSPTCSASSSAHDEVKALLRQAILWKFVARSVRDHLPARAL